MNRSCLFASRAILLAGCMAVLAALSADTSGQEPKVKPAVDPERAFQLGDADKDGKLSKDEFTKLMANNPRVKENPKAADFLLNRLDANNDGSLTLEEFKKITELAPKKDFAPKKASRRRRTSSGRRTSPHRRPRTRSRPRSSSRSSRRRSAPCWSSSATSATREKRRRSKGGLLLDTRDGIRKRRRHRAGRRARRRQEEPAHQGAPARRTRRSRCRRRRSSSDEVIADFEKWVATGAADPRDGTKAAAHKEIDIEKGRQFWAFQPPKKTAAPGREGRRLAADRRRSLRARRTWRRRG